jgi:multidrug efflux pump subunit AcrB
MWIVRLALRQPHTFIVMAILIALFGFVSISQMAIDIFPKIDVPIVSCIWTYTGMSPDNIEGLITTVTERALTSTVNGIEHMESMSVNGISVIKVFLHKGTDIGQAIAQVDATATAVMRSLPPHISPPFVTQSSATDVPVLELGVGSKTLSEAELFDIGQSFIRIQLAVVQGATVPFPYGGKYRQVNVDLDPKALLGYGLSAKDVTDAVNAGSVIAPSGTAKMGRSEYVIALNNMPTVIDQINQVPIKHIGSATVFVKDVAFVHDGFQPQLNVVNLNGRRAVIMNILKNGAASTLRVVNQIKKLMPQIRASVPKAVNVDILVDQSKFVKESVDEVLFECASAAGLTALFMLAILGSWRSTLIVITSIPLAMFSSIIGLNITGNTINVMTLGGLALAVGMLVDDATVEVENVHRQLDTGKHVEEAVLASAEEVAVPAFVSTISICTVFLPVFMLSEPARSLFVPLGEAVTFAMLASYGLSRTIVPLMSKRLFAAEEHVPSAEQGSPQPEVSAKRPGFFLSIHLFIDDNFNRIRDTYHSALNWSLANRLFVVCLFLGFYAVSFCLIPQIGSDFFPMIDAHQMRLHLTVPAGTRVEQTERIFRKVENAIKQIVPADEIEAITDNMGIPVSGVNYAFSDSQTISEADGEILVSLKEDKVTHPTKYYMKAIRKMLSNKFPECSYYFQPADIVTQILNAGLPAPIDVKVMGFHKENNFKAALDLKRAIEKIPGAVDVTVHQVTNSPQYMYVVDRTRADQLGLTQQDISDSLLINLSSSFQVAPNFWVNPKNGVQYYLAAQAPQYRFSSINDLDNLNVSSASTHQRSVAVNSSQTQQTQTQQIPGQLLRNVARPERQYTPYVVSHYNVQPTYDVYAACQDRDLGGVSDEVQKHVDEAKKGLPRGSFVYVFGQVLSMKTAFIGLLIGLVGAVVLVYLLLVVNYQSWIDPLIILMAIPGALAGIVWSLFVTQTTFSVPALMGTIMTIGVACANSILMITFCNEQLRLGQSSTEAASNAGLQRFRPVCMTAMAMILGMGPMSLSQGMNAPIGRAMIGGLSVATFSTLIFVPLMYSILRRQKAGAAPMTADNQKG